MLHNGEDQRERCSGKQFLALATTALGEGSLMGSCWSYGCPMLAAMGSDP